MQGISRDADIQRPRNPTHVIDYILKPSLTAAVDRAKEALSNPFRYVERIRQLWQYPQHWSSGKLGRIIIPAATAEDVLCGLTSKGIDIEYEMSKTSRPRTKNLPIPIAES